MGVYAAMSVAGGAISLIAGDLLTMYISWRWVSFVDVPIGLAAALAAPRVLAESRRQRGRFDLPGAVTGTGVSLPSRHRRCCLPRPRSSRPAASIPCCRGACWLTATAPARA